MSTPTGRDLVGYGGRPPHPRWPGPRMLSLGLHLRLIGHPSRAAGLERALDYIAGHQGVWFTRRIDIARHRVATHPAPAH